MDDQNNLGDLIRFYRKRNNYKQNVLALKIGISTSEVSRWENSVYLPEIENQEKLCVALGLSALEKKDFLKIARGVYLQNDQEKKLIPELLERYKNNLMFWAKSIHLGTGRIVTLDQVFIPVRLYDLEADSESGTRDEKNHLCSVESIIERDFFAAAIMSPAGYGKSVICKRITQQCLERTEKGMIPVPILSNIETDSLHQLILNSFPTFFPDLSKDEYETFANYLESLLLVGTAILLLDNWQKTKTDEQQLEEYCQQCKKIVIFTRQPVRSRISQFSSYELLPLDVDGVTRFINTRCRLEQSLADTEKIIANVKKWGEKLPLNCPAFLDLFLQNIQPNKSELSYWEVIDTVINHYFEIGPLVSTLEMQYRSAVSEYALSLFERVDAFQPISDEFENTDIESWLRKQFGSESIHWIHRSYEDGIIRITSSGKKLAFPHPLIQAALAAEAWIRCPAWLTAVNDRKSNPAFRDIIICTAAKLAHDNRFAEFIELINKICDEHGNDLLELNILLAGECLAVANDQILEKVKDGGFIEIVSKKFLSWLIEPRGYELTRQVLDLLEKNDVIVSDDALFYLLKNMPQSTYAQRKVLNLISKRGGKKALGFLHAIATDEENFNQSLREDAVLALGMNLDQHVHNLLVDLLQDKTLRPFALQSLAAIGTQNAVKSLFEHLSRDKNEERKLIEKISNPEALEFLQHVLTETSEFDEQIFVAFSKIGSEKAVTVLHDSLNREKRFRRLHRHIAKLLGTMVSPAASEALLSYAEDETRSPSNRAMVVECLPVDGGLWNPDRIVRLFLKTQLIRSAEKNNPSNRSPQEDLIPLQVAISHLIAKIADEEIVARLVSSLKDTDVHGRQSISWILAQAKPYLAKHVLLELLEDPNPFIRENAIYGLGRRRVAELIPVALTDLDTAIENGRFIDQFADALSSVNCVDAIPLLEKAIDKKTPCYQEAIKAIGKIGGSTAADALVPHGKSFLSGQPITEDDAKALFEALSLCATQECIRMLVDIIADASTDFEYHTYACNALANVSDSMAEHELIRALRNPNDDVREYAVRSLGNMHSSRAIQALLDLADDPIKWVWEEVQKAVDKGYSVTHKNPVEFVDALKNNLQAPSEKKRLLTLQVLKSLPVTLMEETDLESVRSWTETENQLTAMAIAVLGHFSNRHAGLKDHLLAFIKQNPNPGYESKTALIEAVLETRDPIFLQVLLSQGWINPNTFSWPVYIETLIKHRPYTDVALYQTCLQNQIRILGQDDFYLPDGRHVTGEDAGKWLRIL